MDTIEVGTIVWLWAQETPKAAVITAVQDQAAGLVSLFVMGTGTSMFLESVPRAQVGQSANGHWTPKGVHVHAQDSWMA